MEFSSICNLITLLIHTKVEWTHTTKPKVNNNKIKHAHGMSTIAVKA